MKNWFINAASEKRERQPLSDASAQQIVNPGDSQVISVPELIARTQRGQDISNYERYVLPGMESDDEDQLHSMVSLDDFQKMDFSEQREFARMHGESVKAMAMEIDKMKKGGEGESVPPSKPVKQADGLPKNKVSNKKSSGAVAGAGASPGLLEQDDESA